MGNRSGHDKFSKEPRLFVCEIAVLYICPALGPVAFKLTNEMKKLNKKQSSSPLSYWLPMETGDSTGTTTPPLIKIIPCASMDST